MRVFKRPPPAPPPRPRKMFLGTSHTSSYPLMGSMFPSLCCHEASRQTPHTVLCAWCTCNACLVGENPTCPVLANRGMRKSKGLRTTVVHGMLTPPPTPLVVCRFEQTVSGMLFAPRRSEEHFWVRDPKDLEATLGGEAGDGVRPKVFVSRGNHATYPVSGTGERLGKTVTFTAEHSPRTTLALLLRNDHQPIFVRCSSVTNNAIHPKQGMIHILRPTNTKKVQTFATVKGPD